MRAFALAALFLVLMIAPTRAQTTVLTLAGDDWCPYVCGQSGERPGILVEIARKAFEGKGVTIDYKTMPWARALKDTRSGQYAAALGAMHDDAVDLIYPDTPQAQSVVTCNSIPHCWQR